MKINEVFEGLAIDEGRVYLTNRHSRRYEISIGENGFVMVRAFNDCGQLINPSLGAGGFSGNLKINDEWELKREKVDFLTAINSGKNIKSCTNASFHSVDRYLKIGCALVEINGLWEIE